MPFQKSTNIISIRLSLSLPLNGVKNIHKSFIMSGRRSSAASRDWSETQRVLFEEAFWDLDRAAEKRKRMHRIILKTAVKLRNIRNTRKKDNDTGII